MPFPDAKPGGVVLALIVFVIAMSGLIYGLTTPEFRAIFTSTAGILTVVILLVILIFSYKLACVSKRAELDSEEMARKEELARFLGKAS